MRLIAPRPFLLSALATAALAGCGSASSPSAIAPGLLSQARPIGPRPRFSPPVTGPVLGDCRPKLGARFGAHVETFAANKVVLVPAGIGTQRPRRYSAARIIAARCYGSLVTIDPTGVILVRAGAQVRLSDLFRSWGQPLTEHRLASFAARRVVAFVNGRRWTGRLPAVPLTEHAEIVLEAGPYVLPHRSYLFGPGT